MFSHKFKKEISRRAVRDIRNNEAIILSKIDSNHLSYYKFLILVYESIDADVYNWMTLMDDQGGIVTDNLIKVKALTLAK